jgi:hypothetical protein
MLEAVSCQRVALCCVRQAGPCAAQVLFLASCMTAGKRRMLLA